MNREEGCHNTGVMLKGLKANFTVDNLQSILAEMKLKYNFLYLPWDSKRNCESGLGFINFLDVASAKRCIQELKMLNSQDGKPRLFRTIHESYAHGIARNLAFFIISAGMKPIDNDHAPLVFDDSGHPMDLRFAISQFVNMDILLDTEVLWKKSRQEKAAIRAAPQSGNGSDLSMCVSSEQVVSQKREMQFQQRAQDVDYCLGTWQAKQKSRQNLPSPCLERLHAAALPGFHPVPLGGPNHAENKHVAAIPSSHSLHLGEQSRGVQVSQGSVGCGSPRPATYPAQCDPGLFRRPKDAEHHYYSGSQLPDALGQQQASGVSSMATRSVVRIGDQEFTVYGF